MPKLSPQQTNIAHKPTEHTEFSPAQFKDDFHELCLPAKRTVGF